MLSAAQTGTGSWMQRAANVDEVCLAWQPLCARATSPVATKRMRKRLDASRPYRNIIKIVRHGDAKTNVVAVDEEGSYRPPAVPSSIWVDVVVAARLLSITANVVGGGESRWHGLMKVWRHGGAGWWAGRYRQRKRALA